MEGNYLVVKAYEYTSMLSAALLDSWSTPVCLILSFIFMRVRYRWVQYAGVFVALCGMGMLVGSDAMTGSTFMASDPVKGNLFCILGATFYGISNTSVEYLSRKHPIYEVNGMFTLFAAIINLVQMVILERNEFSAFVNNSYAIALVIVYTICMFILYSLAPVLFRWGSAVLYNLSLLTSDFYSLIFGLGLFGYSVSIRAIHCFGEPEIKTSYFSGHRHVSICICCHHPWYRHIPHLPCTCSNHRERRRSNKETSKVDVVWILFQDYPTSNPS